VFFPPGDDEVGDVGSKNEGNDAGAVEGPFALGEEFRDGLPGAVGVRGRG
jgi:hypothetical protein